MTEAVVHDDDTLPSRLAALLTGADGAATITGIVPVFGGNARKAWAFDALWENGRKAACIMLSQMPGKHVDSDTAAEYRVLHAMTGRGVRAPAAIALDAAGTVTGGPSLILERVRGDASAVTFLQQKDAAIGRALTLDLAKATAGLHSFDWMGAGLTAGPENPILAEILLWEQRFLADRMEPLPVLAYLFRWLKDHIPTPAQTALVHGDLRPGNFLFEGDKVTALLDWEMAHIGDPAEDIAWIYRTLWNPGKFLSMEEFTAAHSAHSGFKVPPRTLLYYRIFSEVKFATISVSAANSFFCSGNTNLRHIDRTSKVAEAVRLSLDWIDSESWETRNAPA